MQNFLAHQVRAQGVNATRLQLVGAGESSICKNAKTDWVIRKSENDEPVPARVCRKCVDKIIGPSFDDKFMLLGEPFGFLFLLPKGG